MHRSLIAPFRIRLHSTGSAVAVIVSGELDLSTAPRLAAALDRVSRLEPEVVVVDLEEVDFMDCAGLKVLLRAADELDAADGRSLEVTGARCQVRKLFELTGTEQLLLGTPAALVGAGLADAA